MKNLHIKFSHEVSSHEVFWWHADTSSQVSFHKVKSAFDETLVRTSTGWRRLIGSPCRSFSTKEPLQVTFETLGRRSISILSEITSSEDFMTRHFFLILFSHILSLSFLLSYSPTHLLAYSPTLLLWQTLLLDTLLSHPLAFFLPILLLSPTRLCGGYDE